MTLGLVSTGLAAAIAGGAGIAAASTSTSAPAPSETTVPYGHPGNLGGMYGMHGAMFGENSPIAATAKYLGLSETDLQTQLRAGKSLADITKAQGKSVSGLRDAMVAAIQGNLDANTTLTADQKKGVLDQIKNHFDTMVTTTHSPSTALGRMEMGMEGMFSR